MIRKQTMILALIAVVAVAGLSFFSTPAQSDAIISPQGAVTPTPTINPLDYVCSTQTAGGLEICAEPAEGLSSPGLPLPNNLSNSPDNIQVYFFWGDGCPHCAEEEQYLTEALNRLPISVHSFETWYNNDNKVIYERMAEAYGFEANYVPATFIGDQYWIGFSEQIQVEIEQKLQSYAADPAKAPDAASGILIRNSNTFAPDPNYSGPIEKPVQEQANTLNLPVLGTVNLAEQSIVASTALIALVDGVNPCSVWVLSVLLALTLHTGSRKKVLIIGLTFITITAVIYAIFIAGVFTILTFVSFIQWIQILIAVVAMFFALVNIKDYFWFKEGLSFTIAEEDKPGIYKGMRRVLNASQSVWGLISATIVLAAGVSLVEFSCTAGFPVLWSNLLVSQNVPHSEFIWLILLYMLIYQLDELVFFGMAVVTLRATKMEEKHGRVLKLFSGLLMLSLSVVMVINPELMNNLANALIIFGTVIGATILITLLHQLVLPKLGISIGSEVK